MIYSMESILNSVLLSQDLMIYLHVLHILAHTEDVPDLYCTFSLVLHILTHTAHPHSYCTSSLILHVKGVD